MTNSIRVGRVLGIDIRLHYSWLLIAFLIVFSLRAHFQEMNPDWGGGVIWASALVTGVLFFAAVVAHELAHSVVAKSRGIGVRSITLFALGGVAQIEKDASDAKTEFLIAIVGPFTSFIIGAVFLTLAGLMGSSLAAPPTTPLPAILLWLGYINVALAVFNLIPGFPMDGGRVLRAILWWFTGSDRRATHAAVKVGKFFAVAFILFGVVRFFSGGGLGALWISFIGWFLLDAAGATGRQSDIAEHLRGLRVADVMVREVPTIDGRTNLQTFTEDLFRTGRRCFIVVENGVLTGLITPNEVKHVRPAQRPFTLVSEVMRTFDHLRTIAPESPVIEALEVMARDDLNQHPVVSGGAVEGVISRADLLGLLQNRIELSA